MKARLILTKEIAEDYGYFEFRLDNEIGFQAGQFFKLTLSNSVETDNRGNSRFFGFVNSPSENKIAGMVTKKGVSCFKKMLFNLPIGTEVEIGMGGGNMILPDSDILPLVFVTRDVGIAPVVSILKYVQENNLKYYMTLVCYPPVLFAEELKSFAKNNPRLILSDELSPGDNKLFYITGAGSFVIPIVSKLREAGVKPEKIKMEIFTGY